MKLDTASLIVDALGKTPSGAKLGQITITGVKDREQINDFGVLVVPDDQPAFTFKARTSMLELATIIANHGRIDEAIKNKKRKANNTKKKDPVRLSDETYEELFTKMQEEGTDVPALAREHNVHPSTLYARYRKWVNS